MKLKSSQMILRALLLALCLFLTYNSTYFMSERFAFLPPPLPFQEEKVEREEEGRISGESARCHPSRTRKNTGRGLKISRG